MRLGIFAKTFPGEEPLPVLKAARDAGFASVQYNFACSGIGALPESVPQHVVQAIQSATAESGMAIAAVSATYNMIHPNLVAREKGRRSFRAIAAVAHDIGCDLLTVCTGSRDAEDQWRAHPDNDSNGAWDDLLTETDHLLAIADEFDVRIGVEPELANVISSARKARQFLDRMKNKRIGIVLDPANLFETEGAAEREKIINDAVGLLKNEIVMAHAKDRRADGSFAAAGNGVISFASFISSLQVSGFQGDLITHGLSAAEAKGVNAFLTNTLQQMRPAR
jgi:sugar phosphate isomerase/epimerase